MAKNDKALTRNPRDYAQGMVDARMKNKGTVATFRTIDAGEMARLIDKYDVEPPVAEVSEGQIVEGLLIGKGSPVEMASQGKDPKTGEEIPGNVVGTWIIELDEPAGMRVKIMSGYQLDHYLPGKEGQRVMLIKGVKKDRGSKQVREWIVGSEKTINVEVAD